MTNLGEMTAEQLLGEMTLDELLDHADRMQYLRELGVRTTFHAKGHVCIHKSPTSKGVSVSTPTAKNIVANALNHYKILDPLQRQRVRIERRDRAERERAAEVVDRDAATRFRGNR